MSTIERMTVTMPAEMATFVKGVVETGDYASTSEVVREAIRDLKAKRSQQVQLLEALRNDIDKGLADMAAGRVKPFDADTIVARGRALLADTRSA
jgi:antitoxin ParD1/3/4